MTASPKIQLDAPDAAELAEMLIFISDWFAGDAATLTVSLKKFVGATGYDIDGLQIDLSPFAFLLTGSDADAARLFGGDDQ